MKIMLEMAVALVTALGMFIFGVAVTAAALGEEPKSVPASSQSVVELWTEQPRKVNRAAQKFERLPSIRVVKNDTVRVAAKPEKSADPLETALDATETSALRPLQDQFANAHGRWCVQRYRSYRSDDDSYISYSGARRTCVSPYSNDLVSGAAFAFDEGGEGEPLVQDASHAVKSDGMADHLRKCFTRYRSYRPEDNSYQPYDGGPRRRCR